MEDGEQLQPGGFNTVVLPFADEVREAKAPQASDGDVKAEGEQNNSPKVQRACLRVVWLCSVVPSFKFGMPPGCLGPWSVVELRRA